jgi:hypothetical protein
MNCSERIDRLLRPWKMTQCLEYLARIGASRNGRAQTVKCSQCRIAGDLHRGLRSARRRVVILRISPRCAQGVVRATHGIHHRIECHRIGVTRDEAQGLNGDQRWQKNPVKPCVRGARELIHAVMLAWHFRHGYSSGSVVKNNG